MVDEENIRKIIQYSRRIGSISCNLVVFNEAVVRLDKAIKDMVVLFIQSFGVDCIRNLAILYTHSYGRKPLADLRVHANSVAATIRDACGVNIVDIPFFCVENQADDEYFRRSGQTEGIEACNKEFIEELLRFTASTPPFSTENAVERTYSYRDEIRNANNNLEEQTRNAQIAREEAERQRIASETAARQLQVETEKNKVMRVWEETRFDEIPVAIEDITEMQQENYRRPRRFLTIPLPFDRNATRMVARRVGTLTRMIRRDYSQTCQLLGSGQINRGDWRLVKETPFERR